MTSKAPPHSIPAGGTFQPRKDVDSLPASEHDFCMVAAAITSQVGTEESAPVDTFELTPENLSRMATAMREEEGLLNFTQASILLGVSAQRVQQLTLSGHLRRFSFCGQHYVSFRDVCARRDSDIKTGRPPRGPVERVKVGLKAALQTDKAQAKLGGFHGQRK